MRLEGLPGAYQAEEIYHTTARQKDENLPASSLPQSWGKDSVTISPAALEALQAAYEKEQQQQDSSSTSSEGGAKQAFAEYMDKAKGKEPEANTPEEQIKKLQEQLKSLHDKMAQVSTSETMSEPQKSSQLESLNEQANSIMNQITELTAALAESKKNGA